MINHTITVRNRRIKVDTTRLIHGCAGSDSIILDLDDEWTGLDEIIVSIGSGELEEPADEWPEYVQPTGAHDAYHVGDKITYNGKHYTCIYDGCVWTPDAYPQGWREEA